MALPDGTKELHSSVIWIPWFVQKLQLIVYHLLAYSVLLQRSSNPEYFCVVNINQYTKYSKPIQHPSFAGSNPEN